LVGTEAAAIMHTPHRSRRRSTPLLLAIAVAALLGVGVASASAASSIEGVWSFGGGQIAVEPAGNGTFVGTVVAATTFAECVHPVGRKIWTDITPQLDGSYWGLHQWYFEKTCEINRELGPTAWRVKEEADGSKYLRVCFSHPGTSQPTIPAIGPETGVTYGCVDSGLTAPLPASGVAGERVSLPSTKQCLSARLFNIHLLEPRYDPFKSVLVTSRGHRIATVRRGDYVVATIDLKGLPRGAFTVKIRATTVLGHHLSGSRTYHTCASKSKSESPEPLKSVQRRG
jgi:hypothetical protein